MTVEKETGDGAMLWFSENFTTSKSKILIRWGTLGQNLSNGVRGLICVC